MTDKTTAELLSVELLVEQKRRDLMCRGCQARATLTSGRGGKGTT